MHDGADLETDVDNEAEEAADQAGILRGRVEQIPLDKIDLDDTTFRYRASLRIGPLKKSIEAEGQTLPIIVRRIGKTRAMRYQIISGFRRTTAMRELGRETIAAIVRDDLDDDDAARRASVLENCQRKTYGDIDRALVIRNFLDAGSTKDDAAGLLGLTKRQVEKIEGLLDLPKAVQDAIDDPDAPFTATHGVILKQAAGKYSLKARELTPWVKRVINEELSVQQLKRALNAAYKVDKPPSPESIFRANDTDREAGVFRFQPVKINVGDLSDDDKAALREELEELLRALE